MPSRPCWKCARRLLLDARFCPFCLVDQRELGAALPPEPGSPDTITPDEFLAAGERLLQALAALERRPVAAPLAAAVRAWQETIYFLDFPGRIPQPLTVDPGDPAEAAAERLRYFLSEVRPSTFGLKASG